MPVIAREAQRAGISRRAATIFALVAVWASACFVYVASRSRPVDNTARWVAERTARVLPVASPDFTHPTHRQNWPPGFQFGYPRSGTFFVDDGIMALLLPAHIACCLAFVWIVFRLGFPRLAADAVVRRRVFWEVVWSSAWRGALWLALPHFFGAYWYEAANPSLTMRGPPPTPMVSMIVATPHTLALPAWGALLGYLGSVSRVARTRAWRSASGTPTSAAAWVKTCVRCGYQASGDRPCPECGDARPLSVGFVYFRECHARLARRNPVDPIRVLHACIVTVMFAWPLIVGVATTLL